MTHPVSRRFSSAALPAFLLGSLILGACGGSDKSVVDEITVEAASLNLSGADMEALERHFTVTPRSVPEAEVVAALGALGLGDVTDNRTIDGSTVTYTDWSATRGETVFTADTVVLYGVHTLDGVGANFDAMTMDGVSLKDPDGVTGTMGGVTLIEPSQDLAENMMEILQGGDATDSADDVTDTTAFRALRVEDVNLAVTDPDQEGTLSVAQLIIGDDNGGDDDSEGGTSDWVLDTVSADFGVPGAPDDQRMRLSMDGATALGVRGEGGGLAGLSPGMFTSLATQAEPMFDQLVVGEATYRSPGFDVDFAGLEVDSEASGRVLTTTSVLQPMEVRLKDGPGSPAAMFIDSLRANGLADITLKGSQVQTFDTRADRVAVTDAQFEIDEGLRMNCDYELSGLRAAAKSLEDSGATVPDISNVQTEEQIDAFMTQMTAFQEAQAEANALIGIVGMDCTVQDVPGNSLVERGYKVASDVTGMPELILKAGLKTQIARASMMGGSQGGLQGEMMDKVAPGVIDFLDTPGQTLRVRMSPEKPVLLGTLSGEDATFDALNLTVEVN